jgi:hypothetical protein
MHKRRASNGEDDMGSMLDGIVSYLKERFGERTVTMFGFWSSIIIIIAVLYGFFVKQLSNSSDKYYEFKLAECKDATKTVAQMASNGDQEYVAPAIHRFDEFYYGELVLFESPALEKQMVKFRTLFVPQDKDLTYEMVHTATAADGAKIRQAALKVSAACYDEIRPSLVYWMMDQIRPPRTKLTP